MSGQAGRYQRSMAGMIGALLLTLLVIGAYVGFRALNRDDLVVEAEAVDYLSLVGFAQEQDLTLAYPADLPEGWQATGVELAPGESTSWTLRMLTDSGRFVGIRQEDASIDSLLDTYVDEDAEETDLVQVPGSVAPRWQAYRDDGGDHALAAEVPLDDGGDGGATVLVYGSAPVEELELLAAQLTTDPLR